METGSVSTITLLLVGMITVFAILMLVVFIGNSIIFFTNRFMNVKADKSVSVDIKKQTDFSTKHLAVLTAVVETITGGKGKIEEIRKL